MKKKISIIALVMFLVSMLSSCSRSTQSTAAPEFEHETGFIMEFEDQSAYIMSEEDFSAGFDPSGHTSHSYTKLLSGDLSDFAGVWINGDGSIRELLSNGIFFGGYGTADFKRTGSGANEIYSWWESLQGDGLEVRLYPAGTEVVNWENHIIPTDTTKIRMAVYAQSSDEVYYRQGETPVIPGNRGSVAMSDDLVLGTWTFAGGNYVYFFGNAPLIEFRTDNVVRIYEQGPDNLVISRTGNWSFTSGGQLMVVMPHEEIHYYFTFEASYDSLTIIDSDRDSAVFHKVFG